MAPTMVAPRVDSILYKTTLSEIITIMFLDNIKQNIAAAKSLTYLLLEILRLDKQKTPR